MRLAISAYSIAVAPSSFVRNRARIAIVQSPFTVMRRQGSLVAIRLLSYRCLSRPLRLSAERLFTRFLLTFPSERGSIGICFRKPNRLNTAAHDASRWFSRRFEDHVARHSIPSYRHAAKQPTPLGSGLALIQV